MVLAQCCDVCGTKYVRDISQFCIVCGENRIIHKVVVVEEEDVEVEDEGSMRGPCARVALQEKTINTLSYTQVFVPPVCRNKNKKYGKRALLAANMGIQHRIMLDNYEQVKKWVVHAQEVGRLPQGTFKLEGVQESLRQIINENCPTLQEIKLGRKNHKWDEREIYKFLKHHIRYLRRKKRNAKKLTRNNIKERVELNEVENDSHVEENRDLYLMDRTQDTGPSDAMVHGEGKTQVFEMEAPQSIEDDETFLLVVLSLPIVDIMKKHLRKVMEELNARVTPKPFGVGYRKWDKEKQVREVAKYYRKRGVSVFVGGRVGSAWIIPSSFTLATSSNRKSGVYLPTSKVGLVRVALRRVGLLAKRLCP